MSDDEHVDRKPQLQASGSTQREEKPKFTLKIRHQGQELKFLVKYTTQFSKIFDNAHNSFNMQPGTLRFMYEGKRVRETETPGDHAMQDDEDPEIEAHVEQLGGCLLIGC
ncbi:hypothetical protein BKA62DRAFT_696988 [Auriculariales sp. MPI-PUGE-AT-0066]|nr:hypothetical protein BKA62DRAFT_696988 [Auriculariales sp. MPI-PUGE-AT-0066]